MKKSKITLGVGALSLALAFLFMFFLNLPTRGEQVLRFPSVYKDKSVTLEASYYNVPCASHAVLICPGYSCDRQKWRPFADLCVANGLTTMTFDYAGQGASSASIGFDNAKTDAIPEEIADAIEVLHEKSGVPYENIILLGHSMGGRSILRLLDDYNNPTAVTRITRRPIGSAILLSPEVNYHYNAQASLFAGTSDDAEEPWHSYSPRSISGTNLYLFGSTADDIVSEQDVLSIYAHVGGPGVDANPWSWHSTTNRNASANTDAIANMKASSKVTVGITNGVLHSYEMYSPKFAAYANRALTEITGTEMVYPEARFRLIYVSWFLTLLGLFLSLKGLLGMKKETSDSSEAQVDTSDAQVDTSDAQTDVSEAQADSVPTLLNARAFLLRKMLLWLPGTVAAFLLCCICVVMPFGSPVMNTPYMCFIAGYGLTMLFFYRKGKFKGTSGKLPRPTLAVPASKKREALVCCGASIVLCFVLWYVLRATMYRLIPLNFRLFWVLFAGILMTAGYYVSGCESDMLDKAAAARGVKLAYNLIQYVPLFLLVGFYLVLKSYSGMIGQIQNMLLMYLFCVPLGDYIRKSIDNRLLGAFTSAFLFQTLMITSSALISMF